MEGQSTIPTVSVLTQTLDALETQQHGILQKLKDTHEKLSTSADEPTDEMLDTLRHYINQAGNSRRRMVQIQERVSDLKRRADRLQQHKAKQDKQMAEWMAQERTQHVPIAVLSSSNSSPTISTSEPDLPTIKRKGKRRVRIPTIE